MPTARATASAVGRAVAGEQPRRRGPARAAAAIAAARLRAERVGDREHAEQPAVEGDVDRRLRRRGRGVARPSSARDVDAVIAPSDARCRRPRRGRRRGMDAVAGGGLEARRARARPTPCAAARSTIAAASGCSLPRSTAAASREQLGLRRRPARAAPRSPPAGRGSACRSCRTPPCRSRRRSRAPRRRGSGCPSPPPRPVATMIAVGVARPIAHGQAMIRTAIDADERERQPRLRPEDASRRRTSAPRARAPPARTSP